MSQRYELYFSFFSSRLRGLHLDLTILRNHFSAIGRFISESCSLLKNFSFNCWPVDFAQHLNKVFTLQSYLCKIVKPGTAFSQSRDENWWTGSFFSTVSCLLTACWQMVKKKYIYPSHLWNSEWPSSIISKRCHCFIFPTEHFGVRLQALLVVLWASKSRMRHGAFGYQALLLWTQLPALLWKADSSF